MRNVLSSTIVTRYLINLSKYGLRFPKGLPIYLRVHENEIPYQGVESCGTTSRGSNNLCHKGVQLSDLFCIYIVCSILQS